MLPSIPSASPNSANIVQVSGKRQIKWIKGALIGSGSFGSVYLGMDKVTGLLMAVKQVELPTGSSQNEERKKSMLTALEREIELLKTLQHENIVQYLGLRLRPDFDVIGDGTGCLSRFVHRRWRAEYLS
jgi:serine/threonine protein kinase